MVFFAEFFKYAWFESHLLKNSSNDGASLITLELWQLPYWNIISPFAPGSVFQTYSLLS